MKRNMQKIIDEGLKDLNYRYSMTREEISFLYTKAKNNEIFDALNMAFTYGFELGRRAERNSTKKGRAKHE